MNEALGTAIWGQRLDFARYTSDALLECFIAERDAIRAESPGVPITTIFMAASCPAVDLWRWAQEVDVVSSDHYLRAADPRNHVGLALASDLTRSVARGRPWILMEHSTSAVNWQPRNVAKRPGEMRRNALSHLGRGADAIMFFQWRASRAGAEQFHSAMLPHAGTSSRVWREVTALGSDLGRLSELRGSRVRARAAIVWDHASFWAQDLEWRPSVDVRHRERVEMFYDRRAAAANLTEFVRSGGVLVVSYFSGIVDEHDRIHDGPFGSVLHEALGLTIEEFLPLHEGERVRLDLDDLSGDIWAEAVTVDGATVVARYVDGPNQGGAAIMRNVLGSGAAWYLSTRLSTDDLATVLAAAYQEAGIVPSSLPDDVEVIRRERGDTSYVITINHTGEPVEVATVGSELLSGTTTRPDGHTVAAGGVSVVREPGAGG